MKSSAYTFKFLRRTALSFALLVSVTSFGSADQCLNYGDRLNQSHSLYQESIDPYAHLLPDELEQANPLATSYQLDLKPLVVNDLTQLQFNTYDSRSPAAGYTSPYLWEVGGGPRYKGPGGYGGFAPSPFPVRR
ncbi:MAG: hypothetical protein KC800_01720 [Candidatus Eremiobacteraeota bacterium]|nr:hypothetical protein [Candidatus Eremiobacteraeota bacterium]